METNNRIDKIAKKVFSNDSMESTNQDFTANIMSKIIETKSTASIVVEPIISKKAWFIITAFVSAIILLSLIYIPENNSIKTANYILDFGFQELIIPNFGFNNLQINISTTSFYAIISAGFLFMIQLIIIDRKNQQQTTFKY